MKQQLKQLPYVELSSKKLAIVSGGGSDMFWYGVGKKAGILWAASADAGYFRAHKYGGKTKY